MTQQASATFTVKSWDEQPYSALEGQPTLSRADVVYTYHGDLEAEGAVTYLLCASADNISYYIGYERVTGRLGDRSGSFMLQHIGTFHDGDVTTTLTIVPSSATGDLIGLRGDGHATAHREQITAFTLTYTLA